MRKWVFFSFSILLLTGVRLSAQNPYIQHYTTNEGLPSNTVYYIYQDSKKFIWFATDAGVSRYDGTTFTNFRKKDGLSSNEVIRIKEDLSGRVWFFHLNGRLDYFFQHKIINETALPALTMIRNKTFFVDFLQDKDSVIYFYNWPGEIFTLSPQNKVAKIEVKKEFYLYKPKKIITVDLNLRYMSKGSNGDFIFWINPGIFRMNRFFKTLVRILDKTDIFRVYESTDNCVYVYSYPKELIRINSAFQVENVTLPFDISYSSSGGIKSILKDNSGFLWIVTFDQGTYCIFNKNVVRHFDINQGQSVIQDNENNIWISSMKDGIYKINPYINVHLHYEIDLFQNAGITAMNAKPGWGLWLTNGSTIFLLKNKSIYPLNFHDDITTFNMVYPLKNNKLIAGESGLNFYMFEGIDPIPVNKKIRFSHLYFNLPNIIERKRDITFKKISINRNRNEICSFRTSSLFRFSIDSHFQDIGGIPIGEHVFNAFYNLNDDLVINANKNYLLRKDKLFPDKELSRFDNKIITDHLIIGPATELFNIDGDSIYLYDQHEFFNLSSAFDFPVDHQIRKVVYDDPALYLATDRNIYVCDNPLTLIEHKPVRLQLVDINFRNIRDIVVCKDTLYIASDDGLTIIPEAGLNSITTYIPIPYFKTILVNDKEVDVSENKLRLTGNNKITFDFSCINYSSTPVEYSYRLANSDKTWTTGTVRKVIYQNLTRGNYSFQLRVRKPNSEWSKPVEFKILINATFWQHPMFIIALLLTCAGLFLLFFILRKNIQMKRRELDHQLLTLEQKSLQSMMNPHFIFNSLGSIQNYLLQKKSGQAALYLSQFARLIRQNLNAINVASINLDEEIDRLKNYLDLEKMRMDNKFEYDIEVDDQVEADELQIPSMIIQPFVENAIWHGISSIDEKGKIAIKFRMHDEKSIVVLIEDNGIGMKRSEAFSPKSEEHLSLGMEMTRKRMELLGKKYSVKTAIEFSETSPGSKNPGTRVKLVVPVSS